jgi:hypothetical protein
MLAGSNASHGLSNYAEGETCRICSATGLESTPLLKKPRSICKSAFLVLGTVVCGLLVRFGSLGLPHFVVKYGGSILWALTIYWIVSALLPCRSIVPVALWAGAMATSVEFLKLYHSPWLDAFRLTLPGTLLLGRFFSVWDILAYWFAMAVGLVLDLGIFRSAQVAP